MIQLEFFRTKEECEISALRLTIEAVKSSSDKVRRGTYARLNEVSKENELLKTRLDVLERHICNDNNYFKSDLKIADNNIINEQ